MKKCSFCGQPLKEKYFIEGINGQICIDCLEICNEKIGEIFADKISDKINLKKPYEIKKELDKYVIGQEETKKILSVAVYNHYKRINYKGKVEIQKSNIFLIGPTGSGKTYLMQTLAKILDVPLVIVDATSFTEAGYVGEDVDNILVALLQKTGQDVKKAEKGIVFIDEIDKIAKSNDTRGRDIGGEGVQRALLKMIEGSEISVAINNGLFEKNKVTINTKDILFVFGGAFVGLDKIRNDRLNKNNVNMGFIKNNLENSFNYQSDEIIQEDLIKFGFIEEFVGRVPIITELKKLTKEDLVNILIKPKNAILKQYIELFEMDGIKIKFDYDTIEYIAEMALRKNMGARGLKAIIEKHMLELMYSLPKQKKKEFVITKGFFK